MKKLIPLFGIVLLLLIVSPSFSSVNDSNILATTGTVIYSSSQFQNLTLHQHTFYDWRITAQQFVSYTDAFQMHYDADNPTDSNSIENIHVLRPDYIGLLYRNIHKVSSDSPEYSTFVSNGWLLRDTQGNVVFSSVYGTTSQMVDIGNPDYQSWLADWIYNQVTLHGYNGAFCDDGFGVYVGEIWWDADTVNIINPRTGTIWTDQEVRDALVGLYTHLRDKLPSSLIVPNGIYSGSRWQQRKVGYEYVIDRTGISGLAGEGWWRIPDSTVWYSEASWKSSLDSLMELESYFIKNNPSKMFIPFCYIDGDGVDNQLPPGATQLQVMRYGFASTLLGTNSSRIYLYFSNNPTRLQYAHDNLFSTNIGYPLSNYGIVSGTHLYQRTFSNALILVNPTNTPYQISLAGNYRTLDNNLVNGTYTMTAYTGDVLTPVSH
jgi:hypothetical protein